MAATTDMLYGRDSIESIAESERLFSVPLDSTATSDQFCFESRVLDTSTNCPYSEDLTPFLTPIPGALVSLHPVHTSSQGSCNPTHETISRQSFQVSAWSTLSSITTESPQIHTRLLQDLHHYVLNRSPALGSISNCEYSPALPSTSTLSPSSQASMIAISETEKLQQDLCKPPPPVFALQDQRSSFQIVNPTSSSLSPLSMSTPTFEFPTDADGELFAYETSSNMEAMEVDKEEPEQGKANLSSEGGLQSVPSDPFISSLTHEFPQKSGSRLQKLHQQLITLSPNISISTPHASDENEQPNGSETDTPTKCGHRRRNSRESLDCTPRKKSALSISLLQNSPLRNMHLKRA